MFYFLSFRFILLHLPSFKGCHWEGGVTPSQLPDPFFGSGYFPSITLALEVKKGKKTFRFGVCGRVCSGDEFSVLVFEVLIDRPGCTTKPEKNSLGCHEEKDSETKREKKNLPNSSENGGEIFFWLLRKEWPVNKRLMNLIGYLFCFFHGALCATVSMIESV